MSAIGMLLWILFCCGTLHLAVPCGAIPRAHPERSAYYLLWMGFFGLALTIHYRILAQTGHGLHAVLIDALALVLFSFGHLVVTHLQRQWHAPDEAAGRQESRAASDEPAKY
jgi:hypothetical protein